MLNFLLKTRQNAIVPYTYAAVTARKKHTLTTASASGSGHAAHGLRKRQHGNAEVIWYRQLVFNL